MLHRLISELIRQQTDAQFSFGVVIVDNDATESARSVVEHFIGTSPVDVTYCCEPRQNIALARNAALRHAKGDLVAFFDDDQLPPGNWLLTLYEAYRHYGTSGVLGPVKPLFEVKPPAWVIAGRICERPSYETGLIIDWRKGRTGNVLLEMRLFDGLQEPFRPEFVTGEDQDFFRRMINSGHRFVWCNEAVAYEITPAVRWSLAFMVRRALLRGEISTRHPQGKGVSAVKSLAAVPLYCLILPFLPLLGYHWFVRYLVKMFDHAGRLLALIGVTPVGDNYITE